MLSLISQGLHLLLCLGYLLYFINTEFIISLTNKYVHRCFQSLPVRSLVDIKLAGIHVRVFILCLELNSWETLDINPAELIPHPDLIIDFSFFLATFNMAECC